MNEPENKAPDSELAELKAECAALRHQTNLLLLGLIVASLVLTGFLGVQSVRAGKELDQFRTNAGQVNINLNNEEATLRSVFARLMDYGKTHPDFMPVLTKYGIPQIVSSNAAPAVAPKK
jgi:hypothetical protein